MEERLAVCRVGEYQDSAEISGTYKGLALRIKQSDFIVLFRLNACQSMRARTRSLVDIDVGLLVCQRRKTHLHLGGALFDVPDSNTHLQ